MVVNDYRVHKPDAVSYQYTEVVRKHDLRRKMDGFACFQCQQVSLYNIYLFVLTNIRQVKKQNRLQFLFVMKATALKQQILECYP